MFYDFSFTIPTTATEDNPAELELQLSYGIVHRVTVFWWPGPHGLVNLVIQRFEHQILPTNPSAAFHYDNYTHIMEERFPLLEEPYTLTLVGWGEDCDYDHEVIVGIGVLPPECFPEFQKKDLSYETLLKLYGLK